MAVDTVPEFLLKDEDEDDEDDDIDIDIDPCALSPSTNPPWPMMSSVDKHDALPEVDDILSTFTGLLYYCCFSHGSDSTGSNCLIQQFSNASSIAVLQGTVGLWSPTVSISPNEPGCLMGINANRTHILKMKKKQID